MNIAGRVAYLPDQITRTGDGAPPPPSQGARRIALRDLPCFLATTRIVTPRGAIPVDALRPGDMVLTLDHGEQPVLWVGRMTLPVSGEMTLIRIRAGALGNSNDLVVTAAQRVVLSGNAVERRFATAQVFVHAGDLLGSGAAMRETARRGAVCCQFALARHEVVIAGGAPVESLFLGEAAGGIIAAFGLGGAPQDTLAPRPGPDFAHHDVLARPVLSRVEAGRMAAALFMSRPSPDPSPEAAPKPAPSRRSA